jgi:hypothetical protein
MADSKPTDQDALSKIDTSVPHSARIWNYWMGGKDNYEVDRVAGDAYRETAPNIETMARASRHYLIRAVTLVAGELGVRQFLDIGTGLPTYDNTHQVAQRIAPESRIVCVDNDPLVLRHAQALLTRTPEGGYARRSASASCQAGRRAGGSGSRRRPPRAKKSASGRIAAPTVTASGPSRPRSTVTFRTGWRSAYAAA